MAELNMESHGELLRVRWSHVGIAGAVLGIGSLGALAVVASVKEVDTLSTVALALAILAFVIQILVFVAEAGTSAAQHREMQRINADTLRLLSELRTHAVDTNQIVSSQFDKLLDRFLLHAKAEVSSDAPDDRNEILAEFAATAHAVRPGPTTEIRDGVIGGTTRRDERQLWLLRAENGPNIRMLRPLLRDEDVVRLPQAAVADLARLGFDLITSIEAGIPDGLMLPENAESLEPLERAGLITRADDDEELRDAFSGSTFGRALIRLTSKGRSLAGAITGRQVPSQALEAIPWLAAARSSQSVQEAQ